MKLTWPASTDQACAAPLMTYYCCDKCSYEGRNVEDSFIGAQAVIA